MLKCQLICNMITLVTCNCIMHVCVVFPIIKHSSFTSLKSAKLWSLIFIKLDVMVFISLSKSGTYTAGTTT